MILSTTEPLCIARDPATLQDLWSELARRRARPTLFLTPEWIAVARSGDRRAQITLSIEQSRGIAALARDDDGTIAFAGGEFTDEKDVVAAPGDARAVALALGRWIVEERAPRALLDDVPESAPTADGLASSLGGAGADVRVERLVTAPRLPPPRGFEIYRQTLTKKERHELPRKKRRPRTGRRRP